MDCRREFDGLPAVEISEFMFIPRANMLDYRPNPATHLFRKPAHDFAFELLHVDLAAQVP